MPPASPTTALDRGQPGGGHQRLPRGGPAGAGADQRVPGCGRLRLHLLEPRRYQDRSEARAAWPVSWTISRRCSIRRAFSSASRATETRSSFPIKSSACRSSRPRQDPPAAGALPSVAPGVSRLRVRRPRVRRRRNRSPDQARPRTLARMDGCSGIPAIGIQPPISSRDRAAHCRGIATISARARCAPARTAAAEPPPSRRRQAMAPAPERSWASRTSAVASETSSDRCAIRCARTSRGPSIQRPMNGTPASRAVSSIASR